MVDGKICSQVTYQTRAYTTKDGLSSENGRRIIKDKEGFVWISSDKGLNRYDGNSFYTFKHKPDDPTTIASNSCYDILEDSKGRLWVNTDEGLSLLDKKKQVFTNFFPDTSVMPTLGLSYTQMAEDQSGRIWIGGYYDVLIFDPKHNTFVRSGYYDFAKKSGIIQVERRNSITQSITKKSDTELWLMTVYGLFSVHTPSMTFTYHPHPDLNDYFAFYISHVDKNGTLWIGTYDKCFYTYQSKNGKWKHHICPPVTKDVSDQMLEIKPFGQDTMLMLRSDCMFLYSVKSGKFSPFEIKEIESFGATSQFTNFEIYGDHLYLLKSDITPFVHGKKKSSLIHRINIPLPKGFANNHSYITKSGKILSGDWDKGFIVSCDDRSCEYISNSSQLQNLGPLQLYYCALDGQQYFSTSQTVYRWNEDTNRATEIDFASPRIQNKDTEYRNFVEDKKGNIYIRERSSGIYLIKKGSNTLEYFDTKIKGTSFSALYYDYFTDKLWLATEKSGIYIIDPSTRLSKNYPLSSVGTTKKGFVNDITGDTLGNVFLMMPARGLMHINSRDMKAKLYTTFDGLISDGVRYGYKVKKGLYWFTTEAGIMAFDYKKERFYIFDDEKDVKLFNYRIFLDVNGDICQNFYPKQIIKLDKSIMDLPTANGKIYLKDAKLFGKNIPADSIFKMPHDQNNLIFTFGYLDQTSFQKADLLYSINDLKWHSMEEMTISMYNMSPGDYTIKVRQKYDSDQIFVLKVFIKPPWWETWWFYGLFLTSVLFAGFLIYKKRVADIRDEEAEKNRIKQRISQIEMTALRAQMNPHFIFNCLNSINRFILINDTETASTYLTKFSRLIRMILDASKEEFVTLESELESLKLYIGMESMRFQESFEWKIIVEEQIQTHHLIIPPLLLQPYVENAIWHGLMQAPPDWGIKKLDIHIYKMNDATIIEIIDNGIGRNKAGILKSKTSNQHKSHGISLTEERLKLMQILQGSESGIHIEDLYDAQNNPCGTKVKIILNQL